MVLRALPETNLINTWLHRGAVVVGEAVKTAGRVTSHWDTGLKTGVNEIPSGGDVLRRQIISA